MQKPNHILNETIPKCMDTEPNSVGEILARNSGRLWRGNVRIQANNEPKIFNVFKVDKTVLVINQWAMITDATALTNCTNVYASFYDGTVSQDLTADGIDLSGVPVGTTFFKEKEPTQPYTLLDASVGQIYEPSDKKEGRPFYVQQKSGVDSYIRFHVTTNTILDFTMYLEFTYKLFNGSDLVQA